MKRLSLAALFFMVVFQSFSQEEEKEKVKYTMFSAEASHAYNSVINKNGINLKYYFWVNKEYNFGPEFYFYFPTKGSNTPDFQLDFNFRKILVNFHPVTFDVLLGPAFRNYKDAVSGDRTWNFDGINIGFGIAYRIKNISLFVMPKINHIDPSLQLTSGLKYHFNIDKLSKLNNRYHLNKK